MRELSNVKRVVVKVGSSTLTKSDGGIDRRYINNLIIDIATQLDKGYEIVLVSSGAIAAGVSKLGLVGKPTTIRDKQGCASIGQAELIYEYINLFNVQEKKCAQILLTAEDISSGERALNLRNTFQNLIHRKIVPIVNENDSIAIEEIKVGDNDTLSALVAVLTESDLLIMLSDIDGVYDKNPKEYKDANIISTILNIDEKIESLCFQSDSKVGTGGMYTKISAAKIAKEKGIQTIIANGKNKNVIGRILDGEHIGTHFFADFNNYNIREEYVKQHYTGKIYIDTYRKYHIHSNDILGVEGEFKKGDLVEIYTNNKEIYLGYINVSRNNISKKSDEDAIIYKENIRKSQ